MDEPKRKLFSAEVANLLGVSRNNLINYLSRHNDLRPLERSPHGDYLWSDAEIQAIVKRRATTKRGPKRKKKGA